MAKTSTERKREQRKRDKDNGVAHATFRIPDTKESRVFVKRVVDSMLDKHLSGHVDIKSTVELTVMRMERELIKMTAIALMHAVDNPLSKEDAIVAARKRVHDMKSEIV